ncbi:hypothetical protein CHGG_03831 [Chaetomium globosum CBS 148.51]|uniref:SRP54-type proteins GTP-binding domain-containing protein n=1 Tax=Chaetomium globosum (strain ATCC 6205 / CBS 148.51 / DSM 1962 / NBRC 6347 / NRRL 1970) TaxID=306901 RepID=Q2H315_CHAGB|nr:uncharacterized protein CHGG_03831 [Chaetomium globosum CBS 148.51]EAQ87212.1 hypothetical protein CHGG_03831 [Chaetomium globosum CBS 148.51]
METPDPPLQSRVVDDKSPICIPFILSRIEEYKKQHVGEENPRPFIVGLNGVQGVGKTTLVRALAETLQDRAGLPTLVYRGEPGTHDIPLLTNFLTALTTNKPTPIPQYDKSAFSGLGDRLSPSSWPLTSATSPPRVIILEGWCIGFRPLPTSQLTHQWRQPSRTLHQHKLEHLQWVNSQLAAYWNLLSTALDAFVHIDAEDTEYVYGWRAEQEAQLRRERGSVMGEEQVRRFVDAYYPAYELYTEGVRRGVFAGVEGREGCQLRIVVGRDRGVVESMVI